jgi:hypothetical protein
MNVNLMSLPAARTRAGGVTKTGTPAGIRKDRNLPAAGTKAGQIVDAVAILKTALVSGPGIRP